MAELTALRGRVEAMEVRTTTLERQQFSTTTKLSGSAIFALSDAFVRIPDYFYAPVVNGIFTGDEGTGPIGTFGRVDPLYLLSTGTNYLDSLKPVLPALCLCPRLRQRGHLWI